MRFSERHGYVRRAIQRESLDEALTNRVWNAVDTSFCRHLETPHNLLTQVPDPYDDILFGLWTVEWAQPADVLRALRYVSAAIPAIRERFFASEWHRVLDVLEFLAERLPADGAKQFVRRCTRALAEEKSAYRFVGTEIVEITSGEEIEAIERALRDAAPLVGVRTHLAKAVAQYGKRPEADYENSVKESISAVESLACLIAEDPKATLGKALDAIERRGDITLHPALTRAFDVLYGYTSDEDGIRHKMLEEGNVGRAEALYMLVACAAFVSYLVSKAADAGIDLTTG